MNISRKEIVLIVVAALGYFVDIYDLILFSVVRKASLADLGLNKDQILTIGEQLISVQMFGMLLGGILWGILGDKRGRLSVLFGSIIMYSVANIANGMIQSVEGYYLWRFVAGIGLAGELGAGITLVSETMSKENRGYGTMAVTTFGVLGGVVGGFIAKQFEWRMAYYVGGAMGLALLLLRLGVFESSMFKKMKQSKTQKGNFFSLFKKKRFFKYLNCILIGVPIWYFAGILITFSPEFAESMGLMGISAGSAVVLYYAGLTLGDFSSGLISQLLRSRKKVVYLFLILSFIGMLMYMYLPISDTRIFYAICFFLGFSSGYWAIFVTMASEQFGTNIRSTVTTTVPNFVRGSLPVLIIVYNVFKGWFHASAALKNSALLLGILVLSIAFFALKGLEETFGKDLDYNDPI